MLKIFFSYSHKDEDIRDEIETHLSLLRRQGIIDTWHDRKIIPGTEFDKEIHKEISNADVILLLISPYFMASDYCYDKEVSIAMLRHEASEAYVIPVIAKPCDWHYASFGKLTALPTDGKPITSYNDIHEPLTEITKKLRLIAESQKQNNIIPTKVFTNSKLKIERIRKQEKIDAKIIACLAFEPSGNYIAYSQDYTIFLMPLNDFPTKIGSHNDSSKKLSLTNNKENEESHLHIITDIKFSPNGEYIASSDASGTVKVWSTHSNCLIMEINDHSDAITSICFSKDGNYFASAGYDETVKIYKIDKQDNISLSFYKAFYKKSQIKSIPKHQHDIERIHSMGFSNGSRHIVTGDQQGLLVVREISSEEEIIRKKIHNDKITDIAFSPTDNGLIATCSDDSRIRLVDLFNPKVPVTLGTGESKHIDSMNSVSFSYDGKMLISSACDKFIKIWDIQKKTLLETHKEEDDDFPVDRVSFYPNKYDFGTNTYSTDVSLWRVSSDGSIEETIFREE